MPPKHFADLSAGERIDALKELGLPKFRANQIARHYYDRLEADPSTMTDLPAAAREKVKDALFPQLMQPVRAVQADDGETQKTLWKLHDGTLLESVLMRYPNRATLCISSQAGCGMACPFCATGQGGLDRNLSTGEIVDQVRAASATMQAEGGRLSNIVFMGMGSLSLTTSASSQQFDKLQHQYRKDLAFPNEMSRYPPWGWLLLFESLRMRIFLSLWQYRYIHQTMNCVIPWFPRTIAGRLLRF